MQAKEMGGGKRERVKDRMKEGEKDRLRERGGVCVLMCAWTCISACKCVFVL